MDSDTPDYTASNDHRHTFSQMADYQSLSPIARDAYDVERWDNNTDHLTAFLLARRDWGV